MECEEGTLPLDSPDLLSPEPVNPKPPVTIKQEPVEPPTWDGLTPLEPDTPLVYIMEDREFPDFTKAGIFAQDGEELKFCLYRDTMEVEQGEYLAHIDVHRCLAEGVPLYTKRDGSVIFHGVTRLRYLPNQYVLRVEDPHTGTIFWDEEPNPEPDQELPTPSHPDLGFRFATP